MYNKLKLMILARRKFREFYDRHMALAIIYSRLQIFSVIIIGADVRKNYFKFNYIFLFKEIVKNLNGGREKKNVDDSLDFPPFSFRSKFSCFFILYKFLR